MSTRRIKPGPIGADVDLSKEDVRLKEGHRLTEDLAVQIAERALARRRRTTVDHRRWEAYAQPHRPRPTTNS